MAAPTIDPTQSILFAKVGYAISFQPAASDTPTSWAISSGALPSGVTLATDTGLISGTPAAGSDGVYRFGLKATNGTGTSPEVLFCMGVVNAPFASDSSLEINIDLDTGHVTSPVTTDYALYLKRGDLLQLSVGFMKRGVLVELPVYLITVFVRPYGGELTERLTLNSGECVKIGQYDQTRYRTMLQLNDYAVVKTLNQWLEDGPATDNSWFIGIAEVEWLEAQEVYEGAGGNDLRRTSRSFPAMIAADIADGVEPEA